MSGELVVLGRGAALDQVLELIGELGDDSETWRAPVSVDLDADRAEAGRRPGGNYVVALDDPVERRAMDVLVRGWGMVPATLVHPGATIGSDVRLGEGSVVLDRARLTTNIEAGPGLWMGAGATLSHDGRVGDFVTIGPEANVTGNVSIGELATVGAGAAVIPGCRIGARSVVGPGSVVICDVGTGRSVDGVPAGTPERVRGPYRGKRVLDLALLVLLAVPALIVGTVAAVAVRLTSRGPVFFRQVRVGRREAPFELLKFRSMVDASDNPLFPDASRITRVGAVLRRYSVDELPQLINVARGEMSIVGPRPALPYQLELFDRRQRGRHAVRPGLTGLAQVRGRNRITWTERIEHDLEYLSRQSLLTDVRLLVETPVALLTGRGVEGHPAHDEKVVEGGHGPTV